MPDQSNAVQSNAVQSGSGQSSSVHSSAGQNRADQDSAVSAQVGTSEAVPPLIGRTDELAALSEVARTARSRGTDAGGLRGTGAPVAAILIGGDAGVGKTRLLTELVRDARAQGDLVVIGHCVHFGGDAVPFLPVSEAFGRLARDEPEVVEALRIEQPPIARLLPQRRVIGAVEDGSARLNSADLFDAVVGALLTLAETRGVLVVVEDVHWADGSTRDLLGYLLARLAGERVALAISYRTDDLHRRHPLRPVVAEWARVPGVLRLPVAALSSDRMRELVRSRRPRPLAEPVITRILDRADGNAFFAEQLLAELELDPVGPERSRSVPADLADLLLLRLERLTEPTRRIVRIASVAGRRVSHRMLDLVSGLGEDELDRALREAVDAHVLDRQGTASFAFRHALLAEAVYDDLLPGERVRLHRAYAAVLQAREVRGTDADLARHAREAQDLVTAFHASVRAGDEALRVAAPAEAMAHFENALGVADQVLDGSAPARVDLTLRTARAAALAGHQFRALHLVQDALVTQPVDLPDSTRAELLIDVARYALALDTPVRPFEASSEAMALVPPDPPGELRARVLAVHAHAAIGAERYADAIRWASEAQGLARALGLPEVAADAATTIARADEHTGDADTAIGLLEQSIGESRRRGDLPAQLRGLHSLGGLRYDRGQIPAAIEAYDAAMQRAGEGARPWAAYGIDSRLMAVQARYVSGRWDDALALASADGQAPPPLAEAGLGCVALAVQVGRGDPRAPGLIAAVGRWSRRDGLLSILAGTAAIDLYAQAGRVEDAVGVHDETVAAVSQLWQVTWFQARVRLHALALSALVAAVPTANADARTALLKRGGKLIADAHAAVRRAAPRHATLGPEGRAWLLRADAEWARLRWMAAGDAPSGAELVDVWVSTVDAFGYGHVYETARSQVRLAGVLRATGHHAAAQRAADQARTVARELGAAPLLDELRALSLPGPRGGGQAESALTPREDQVLVLLSDGLTNRQIGRQLYISDKTVSVHVSNILAKLGAGGRTEAAAIARRDGLLDRRP